MPNRSLHFASKDDYLKWNAFMHANRRFKDKKTKIYIKGKLHKKTHSKRK